MDIRPTREEAANNPSEFARLIRWMRASKLSQLEQEKFGHRIGLDRSSMSRKVNEALTANGPDKFTLAQCEQGTTIAFEESLMTQALREEFQTSAGYLFYAMAEYFGVNDARLESLRANIGSTYELWRHSLDNPGEYVRGKVHCSIGTRTNSIRVTETQPKKSKDGQRSGNEETTGYMLPLGDTYWMILNHVASHEPRITMFHSYRIEETRRVVADVVHRENKIIHMDGFEMGIDSSKKFLSPIYIELIDPDRISDLNENLDVLPSGEVPERIRNRLNKIPERWPWIF